MKWLDCTGGVLRTASAPKQVGRADRGLSIFDQPLVGSAVHELLFDARAGNPPPAYLALRVLHRIITQTDRAVTGIWCDPAHTLYPPAIAQSVPLARLFLVYPKPADVTWTAAECLKCPGVGVVIAPLPTKLTRVEARRLQLAAERGGGIGLMLRPTGPGDDIYAAATRWLVAPTPGDRGVQRWKVRLIHGHGRRSGQSFILENRRGHDQDFTAADFTRPGFGPTTIPVRPPAPVVDHPPAAQTA